MGNIAKGVVIILGIMSAYSISVMIERAITYRQARKQSRVFTPAVAECLKEGKIDEAIALGEQNSKSHLAKVLIPGLHELQAHSRSKDIPGETIEAAKRALDRATAIGIEDLKRGLGGLATIGSTAPFVGLFGTVWGIMHALQDIGHSGVASLDIVAGPIGEALIATAIGIATALPAVLAYNFFLRRLRVKITELENFAHDFMRLALKHDFKI